MSAEPRAPLPPFVCKHGATSAEGCVHWDKERRDPFGGVEITSLKVAWFCKCGLSWRFQGTRDGYDVLYAAITAHLRQEGHGLLMNPSRSRRVA